ncbi:MAG: rhodanese-like domain-containing protein [Gammaproteobacteria bacterium SHHR-1]|uniref:rhodanese-like domain-containing protein n=1 Tax=Magnetovirga frankeli TaxID=947516 RepID=UPI001293F313|nr:rhodanese-like domain-containing protein [gamma proteobacterium SS-5]
MASRLGYVCCLLLLFVASPCWAVKPTAPEAVAGASLVDAERVIELAQGLPDLLILDSRRGNEYAMGHIEGALNILDTELTEQRLAELTQDKDHPLLFYCNGPRCLRSSNAAAKAVSWGYRQVYWFRGGWMSWTEKQYPISY